MRLKLTRFEFEQSAWKTKDRLVFVRMTILGDVSLEEFRALEKARQTNSEVEIKAKCEQLSPAQTSFVERLKLSSGHSCE